MATLHVRFGAAMGGGAPIYAPTPSAAQSITTSGSSQASTVSATQGDIGTVKVTGGNVYVTVGQSPTASAGAGFYLGDGDRVDFGPLRGGDKIAVINA